MSIELKSSIVDLSDDELNSRVDRLVYTSEKCDWCHSLDDAMQLIFHVPEAVIMPVNDDNDYPIGVWEIRAGHIYRGENLARLCVLAYLQRNTL